MKKCIYYGYAKDFWWHARFRDFMKKSDFIEPLTVTDLGPIASSLKLPLTYYSHQHDVTIKYQTEETFLTDAWKSCADYPPHIQRAQVILLEFLC